MKPFKMFFGISVAVILLLFAARVAFVAFIAAAIMSIFYAIYRRIKDFITYDRHGEYYIKGYNSPRLKSYWKNGIEPLFQESSKSRFTPNYDTHFVKVG